MKILTKNSVSNQSGFTLLEVLVVVVIIGIMSAIAAPAWLSFLTRQKMNSARADLLDIIQTAQVEAETLQQNREVILSSDLSVTVRDQTASTGGITTQVGSSDLDSDYSLVSPTSIVFDHDGQVPADSLPFIARIVHSGVTSERCVIVTTILGGVSTANDEECTSFDAAAF